MSEFFDKTMIRFGGFVPNFYNLDDNPTLSLQRDFQLVEHMDILGLDECWIGEHHSGGLEFIGSPEIFIAEAAARTKRIRLGTGAISLPYHNPFMVAQRVIQLDHQLRGRFMFGVGAGSLATDVLQLGLDQTKLRDEMREATDIIMRLLKGETVSHQTSRYTLDEARCQLKCFTRPHPELSVASTGTPSAPRLAGAHGGGLLTMGIAATPDNDLVRDTWKHWVEATAENGTKPDRSQWRIVIPTHIAETKEQAIAEVRYGMRDWIKYMRLSPNFRIEGDSDNMPVDKLTETFTALGSSVVGTPDDLIAYIDQLWERSGGFGCFLAFVPNWTTFEHRKKSFDLIANRVVPHFQQLNIGRHQASEFALARANALRGARITGINKEISKWKSS